MSINRMVKTAIFLISLVIFSLETTSSALPEGTDENRVLAVVQKMESAFRSIEDYSCEVEQVFYKDRMEGQHYRFKFYFKKKKQIRVDFSEPHAGLRIFYNDEEKHATVMPLGFLSFLKFHLAVDDQTLRTPAGQRINQTDMGYFIDFLFENLKRIEQRDVEYNEERGKIEFSLLARDYIDRKVLEKYRISVAKENWLPTRIERYNRADQPIEVTMIQNYAVNSRLEDRFFRP